MSISTRSKKGLLEMRRRVPTRYASVEPRTTVWIALGTDSPSFAASKADMLWQKQIERWDALLAGDSALAEDRLAAARQIVETKGMCYVPATSLLAQPVSEILQRVEAIAVRKGKPAIEEARAFLGTVPDPGLKISRTLELFWQLTSSDFLGKSQDQIRRAKNPVVKAVNNFISVVGDKLISDISREDMLDFRDWWSERREQEELTANSANKDFTHLGRVLKTVNQLKRLGLALPLEGLRFKAGEAEQRPPFSDEWIRERLLAVGALNRLNTEARCLLLGMINTGYRPSEGAGLLPGHIQLEGSVPHILIRPEGRQLKTRPSKRTIPLAGVSLDALRECRAGFPRYRDKPGLSATINSFLRANGLMESPEHVFYSLRHSFEDRLLAAGVDERVRRDLMGHALGRERYGIGATLEMAHSIIQQIAF